MLCIISNNLNSSNFSFSDKVFDTIWHLFFSFKCSLKFRLQFVSIWTSLKICVLVMGSGRRQFKPVWEKEKMLVVSIFSLFLTMFFLPFTDKFGHFDPFLICYLQFLLIGTSLQFHGLLMRKFLVNKHLFYHITTVASSVIKFSFLTQM